MKRWLICGVNHHGYLDMIARGFEEIGHRAAVFSHPPLTVEKLATRNPLRRWLKRRPLTAVNEQLLARCREERPDVLLCINGEAILDSTLSALRGTCALGFWAVDAMENVRMPVAHLPAFNRRIFFVPEDMGLHRGDLLLGYAHDPRIYRPLELPREVDLSFVGAPHHARLPVLEQVAAFCLEKGLTFGVWGPSYFSHRALGGQDLRRDYPHLAQCIRSDQSLPAPAVNEVYNRSRMVLNIHSSQCRGCLNARTFEILAAGAVGVIDDSPAIDGIFERGLELIAYRGTDDLCEQVAALAAAPERCREIAARGRTRSVAEHTFAHRAEVIGRLFEAV